jgi:hypothetical protein
MHMHRKSDLLPGPRRLAFVFLGLLLANLLVGGARGQSCTPRPPGLVSWWQGEGNAFDFLELNNGQLQGSVAFPPGETGQAFSFNGANADVMVPASASLDVGAGGGVTIDLWVNPTTLNEQPFLEWNMGDFQAHFWMSAPVSSGGAGAGCLFADLKEANLTDHVIASAGGLLASNTFQHVALTYDTNSGVAALYLNGAMVVQQILGSFTPNTTGNLYFGLRPAGPGAGMRFAGRMDEIDVFNRALDSSEIAAIYAAGTSGKCGYPPIISTQPASQIADTGDNVTFTVEAGGSPPLAYQWLFEGVTITGATRSSLAFTNVQMTNAGNYTVSVTNSYGLTVSDNATLTVVQPVCTPAPAGLVGWWQAEGDAADGAGTNNGILQGGVTFVPGNVGQAWRLNGTSGYVSIPASASLNVGTGGALTIEGWISPADLVAQSPLMEWNDGSGGLGVHFWINQAAPLGGGPGSLFANLIDTSGAVHTIASSGGLLTTNGFQHVALSYDQSSGTATLYYNGVAVASQPLGTFTPQTSYGLYFGKRPSGPAAGALYSGGLDELSLYNRALSDSEVQAIYQSGNAGKCIAAPVIVTQPASQNVGTGNDVIFNVVVSGAKPLTYQWRRNTGNLPGATNSSLTLSNVQPAGVGSYSVVLSNPGGATTSSDAVLTVFTPACISTPAGLAGSWQGEGETSDSAGLNNGTAQGNLFFSNGKVGRAIAFNGTNGFVSIAASPSLNVGTNGGFTIEGWVRPEDGISQLPLVEWNNGSGGFGVHFWINQAAPFGSGPGSLYANLIDTNGTVHYIASSAGILVTNGFQHVALTYDRASGTAMMWLNGAVVATQNIGAFTPQTSYNLFLGRRPSGSPPAYFKGAMDEMCLYSRALTTNEIQAIYAADTAGKCAVAPAMVLQPQNQSAKPGSNVTFSAGIKGSRPMTWQWRLNGINLAAATNFSLTLSNVQATNAGNYSVTATNGLGNVASLNAILKVNLVSITGNGQLLTNSQYGFGGSVTIQMQNFYTNGYIFYTLDGSTPGFGSTQYTGPFVITQSSTIRAVGFSPDFFLSAQTDPIGIVILPTYTLTATTPGGGTIARNPASGPYTSNTTVTVTATPASGWSFLEWLGDATGTSPTTSVTMNRNKSVQALFGTTLDTTAAGGGSVLMNPAAATYPFGTVVTLGAIPQPGNYFGLWGNAASGSVNPLVFTVTNANQSVSSLFSSLNAGQVALAAMPVGRGKVTVNPRANTYATGQSVTLTATPDAGQSFIGWSGDAGGTVNPLTIALDQSKVIYANFSTNAKLTFGPASQISQEGFQLTLIGEFGSAYRLDGSTNLLNWTPLITFTNSFGTFQYLDSGANGFDRRFYRSVLLP